MDSERKFALDSIEAMRIRLDTRPIRIALDILQEVIVHSDKDRIPLSSLTYLRRRTRELLSLVGGNTNGNGTEGKSNTGEVADSDKDS